MGDFIKELEDIAVSIKSWAIIIIATIFFAIAAIFISLFGSAENTQKIARLWGKTIIRFLDINVIVGGSENIDKSKSYLITSNHQSYFDIFVLLAALDINFKFIAKASLFKIPFLGWAMKRLGYISIERENLRSALISVKKSIEELNNMTSILIFPEGTRSLDGKPLSFKKGGLGMFLKQGNITVLPIAIKGTVNILRKGSLAIHPGKTVELKILKPIEVSKDAHKEKDKNNYETFIESVEKLTGEAISN